MKQTIGIILIVAAIFVGYLGITKYSDSSASAEVLGIEIEADNKSGQETGMIQLALAALMLGAGVYTLNKK